MNTLKPPLAPHFPTYEYYPCHYSNSILDFKSKSHNGMRTSRLAMDKNGSQSAMDENGSQSAMDKNGSQSAILLWVAFYHLTCRWRCTQIVEIVCLFAPPPLDPPKTRHIFSKCKFTLPLQSTGSHASEILEIIINSSSHMTRGFYLVTPPKHLSSVVRILTCLYLKLVRVLM